MIEKLTHREKEVLRYVVESFIHSALPVGSRFISKQTDMNLSPATIRNVMSDLEDMELLKTPHTSAGRVPTDKGYRYFVNALMNEEKLSRDEIKYLKSQLEEKKSLLLDIDDIYLETSRILGKISHQLAVVTQPFLTNGVFKKLEIIDVASNKILIVLSVESGYVKTVIMEVESEIPRAKLDNLTRFLNERLQGLTLKQIRETFAERVKDYDAGDSQLIQLFINSADKLYSDIEGANKIFVGGTGEIILQPEFDDPKNLKKIIDVAEDKNFVIHIFQNTGNDADDVSISIGEENTNEKLKDYSIICSSYSLGDIKGSIGIIGPKRINYSKMVSLIKYTSRLISELNS
jgi:heat-inducible transcriptional repressor